LQTAKPKKNETDALSLTRNSLSRKKPYRSALILGREKLHPLLGSFGKTGAKKNQRSPRQKKKNSPTITCVQCFQCRTWATIALGEEVQAMTTGLSKQQKGERRGHSSRHRKGAAKSRHGERSDPSTPTTEWALEKTGVGSCRSEGES